MKNIFRAQENNEKNKNMIFVSSNKVGDMTIDNTYGVAEIITLASSFTTKFFADPISEKALKGALIPGGITEKDLRNTILMISDNKNNLTDVTKLYQSLFYIFLEKKQ